MSAHEAKRQGMIRNLPASTGKTLEQWIAVVAGAPVTGRKARADWLEAEHGLGHFQARLVVAEADAR